MRSSLVSMICTVFCRVLEFLRLRCDTALLFQLQISIMAPTSILVVSGFLGGGKTTLILNLLPQLPKSYRVIALRPVYGIKS
jgi:Flp pilus assembly CpaF family ATPase